MASALLQALFVRPVDAQFENFLSSVHDVNFFFTCWRPRDAIQRPDGCGLGKQGYGLEVLWRLAPVPLPGFPKPKEVEKCEPVTRTTARGPAGRTISETCPVTQTTEPENYALLELGLGYSQFSGFQSSDPSFELRGTVRELPSVSMYASAFTKGFPMNVIHPYVGLRSGLIQLNNAQILDRDTDSTFVTYLGTAQAFQVGGMVGVFVSISETIHLFYERGAHYRRLPSVQWAAAGTNRIRSAFPRELDFSGYSFSVGVQLSAR